jgi:hypothetical protein
MHEEVNPYPFPVPEYRFDQRNEMFKRRTVSRAIKSRPPMAAQSFPASLFYQEGDVVIGWPMSHSPGNL